MKLRSTKIILVVTVYDGTELLHHFLDHYRRLGVEEIHVNVNRSIASSVLHDHRPVIGTYFHLVDHSHVCDQMKDRDERSILSAFAAADDWTLQVDLDEFHEYPYPLRCVTNSLEEAGIPLISTDTVDRIANDGTLRELTPSESIFDQFPIGCTITRDWMGLPFKKVMICRRWIDLGPGRHCANNAPVHGPAIGVLSQYRVHHFKWFRGIKERMEERASSPSLNHVYCDSASRMARSIVGNAIDPSSVPGFEYCGKYTYCLDGGALRLLPIAHAEGTHLDFRSML